MATTERDAAVVDARTTDQVRADLDKAQGAYLALSDAERRGERGQELIETIKADLRVLIVRGEAT